MNDKNSLVLLSGGIDSFACAHFLIKEGFHVQSLYISYGQAANPFEMKAASSIAKFLSIPHQEARVDLGQIFGGGEIYGRNALFIFLALIGTRDFPHSISIGIHSGTPYYDCSTEFLNNINNIVQSYTGGTTKVLAPFASWNKGEILSYFTQNQMPIDLTYSCENGLNPPCGKCLSCKDRECLKN